MKGKPMKEYTQYPQSDGYSKTCRSCKFSEPHNTLSEYVICRLTTSKHYGDAMKLGGTCSKHQEVDTKTPSLFE